MGKNLRRRRIQIRLTAAAAGIISACAANAVHSQTIATWLNAVDGSWTDATKWSTNPQYPKNGSPTNATYDVQIGAANTAYTVSLASPITLSSLTLESSDTRLLQSGGTLVTSQLSVQSGTYQLQGGTLLTSTINIGANGVFNAAFGEMQGFSSVGTMLAGTAGNSLRFNSSWHNGGTVVLSSGTLALDGVFNTGDIGTIVNNGGQVVLSGSDTNTGTVLQTSATSGALLISGRITGGSISQSVLAPISLSNPEFDDVTLNGSFSTNNGIHVSNLIVPTGSSLTVNSGSMTVGLGGLIGSQTLTGGGQIILNGAQLTYNMVNATVSIGSDMTVVGTGSINVLNGANYGTIWAKGNILTVGGLSWINNGLLKASDGGELDLTSQVQFGPNTQFDSSNGAIVITGTLVNANKTLTLNGVGNSLYFSGAINGGTIHTSNGAKLTANQYGSTAPSISGTYLDSDLYVGYTNLTLVNGTTVSPGHVIHMISNAGDIRPDSTFSGEILFEASSGPGAGLAGPTQTHTFGSGLIVRTAGGDILVGNGGITTTNNYGLISAETAGNTIDIYKEPPYLKTFNNYGRLQVSAGTFANDANLINFGTISVSGGTFNLGGTWDNSSGSILLSGGTLNFGGTVNVSKIGTLVRTGGTVALTGTLNNPNTTADFTSKVGAWQTAGNATISGGSIVPIVVGQPLQITTGTLTASSASIDSDIVISPGAAFQTAGAWVNHATVSGNNATLVLGGTYTTATIGAMPLTNSNIYFSGTVNNTGANLPTGFGSGDTFTVNGGTVIGGTVGQNITGLTVTAGVFDGVSLATTASVSSFLTIDDGLTLSNGGAIQLIGPAPMEFSGTQSIVGSGEIYFDGTTSGSAVRPISGSTLTIGPNILIRTGTHGGSVGTNSLTTINQGTISARTLGQTITLRGSINNQGTIEALNGATIAVSSSFSTPNYSSGSLAGGAWAVFANSTMSLGTSTITNNNASIRLDGLASNFSAINSLQNNQGSFTITNGRNFTTVGSLTNSGAIGVGTGSVLRVSGTLHNTGSIDLFGGSLIVDDPSSSLTAAPALPQTGSLFDQIGLTIITSNTDPSRRIGWADNSILGLASFHGQSISGSALLVALTEAGDCNLDGVVNFDDLQLIADHWHDAEPSWIGGDFDHDGSFDDSDLLLLAPNWQDSAPLDQSLQSLGLPPIPVPEPTLISLLPIVICLRRRQRRITDA